ncbi:MAG TPA: hypothetical protein VNH38_06615 [Candidatus Dormibacteraeota bacterium]|nr:hypothetical protein [Candidatus Dormibacteraeota bacterium]
MGIGRIKSALALVGACAALSIVLPPLAGLLNAVGSVTLLALAGYSAYRAWAWLETVVEASRRPTTVRRNLSRSDPQPQPQPSRSQDRSSALAREEVERPAAEARRLGRPGLVRWGGATPKPPRDR